ncbi:hypothetical protein L8V01_05755 [Corynebacterium sp. c8Ua_181]|uniref:Uncharacterized protein n=1 Tax=Corynebacterium curieae TaxID=2913500 RepID=A0A9X3MAI7_9CORY|nr:hypothetical protein [Corynebacterium curieae]MCZ9306984.1 hypothetical protein [Corynebacterium curieae]
MPTQNNTPDHTKANGLNLAQRVVLQSAVLGKLYKMHKEEKRELEKQLAPGDKRTVTNDQGVKLGTASMSQPNKKAVCTDPAVLLGMAEDYGLEITDSLPDKEDPRSQKIIDLLFEDHKELFDSDISKEDKKFLSGKILEEWQITGRLPVGWEIRDASTSRMSINKATDNVAKAAIEHMITRASNSLAEITDGKETK